MASSTTTKSGGVGFSALLGLLFVGLKLSQVINWSWWWVLAPFWIGPAVMLVIAAVIGMILIGAKLAERA